jgi:hypothetical protein
MKTIILIAIVLLLLALDWAALHDILRGEPNLYAEYGMFVFSVIVFGLLSLVALRRKRKGADAG